MKKHRKIKQRTKHSIAFFDSCPRWTRWAFTAAVAVAYIAVFHYFFVGPFGFRWKALYGDPKYPDGYEIRGIDTDHVTDHALITWLSCTDHLDGHTLLTQLPCTGHVTDHALIT